MMQIVFNNPVLYVADYPAQNGVEIIDKRHGVGAFIRDAAAQRFREDFTQFVSGEPDIEAFGDFIDDYQALLNQPALMH